MPTFTYWYLVVPNDYDYSGSEFITPSTVLFQTEGQARREFQRLADAAVQAAVESAARRERDKWVTRGSVRSFTGSVLASTETDFGSSPDPVSGKA